MTEKKITDILAAFETHQEGYPREAIDAALAHREEITPHLLEILERLRDNPAKYVLNPGYFAHVFAVTLLAHFREPKAHDLIVDIFSQPAHIVDALWGDLITEDLKILLLRTCNGSVDRIKELILNKDAYEYCRSAAITALQYAALDGVISRKEVLDFYSTLFTGKEAEPDTIFWSSLVSSIYDLYPAELMDVVEQAFEDDLIDPMYIGLDYIKEALESSQEEVLEQSRDRMRYRYLDDVHAHMSWWAMFESEEDDEEPAPSLAPVRPPSPPKSRPKRKKKAKKKRKRKIAKASRKKNRR